MSFGLLTLCISLLAVDTAPVEQLTYQGVLLQLPRGERPTPVKEFSAQCFLLANGEAFYLVQEPEFPLPWIEQFGRATLQDPFSSENSPVIAYQHNEKGYVVPLSLPFFSQLDQLASGAQWRTNGLQFEVVGEETFNERSCWHVKVQTGIARTQHLYVTKDRGIIMGATQTVFMGQGDKFEIQLQLVSSQTLAAEVSTKVTNTTSALLQLKAESNRGADRLDPLNTDQTTLLSSSIPELAKIVATTPLQSFLQQAVQDLEERSQRRDRVAEIAASMLNKPSPKFTLLNLKGEEISSESLLGSVIVLHFWNYQDAPLEQPYGQTGYLDFLHTRYQGQSVKVYGIAIDPKLTDNETRADALRSIKRLQQFMRISYHVTYDGGAVLNAFGNPTRLGEELPLWVVLSPDGTISHYRTGYYEIDPQKGLKLLDEAVAKAMQQL